MKRRNKAKRVRSAVARIALVAAVAPLIATSTHRLSGSTVELAWRVPGYDLSSKFEGGIEPPRAPVARASTNVAGTQNGEPLPHQAGGASNPTLRAKWIIHVPSRENDSALTPSQTPPARPAIRASTPLGLPGNSEAKAPAGVKATVAASKRSGHTYAVEISQTIGFSAGEVTGAP